MSVPLAPPPRARPPAPPAGAGAAAWLSRFAAALEGVDHRPNVIRAVITTLAELLTSEGLPPAAVAFVARDAQRRLQIAAWRRSECAPWSVDALGSEVLALAGRVCNSSQVEAATCSLAADFLLHATPVLLRPRPPEALVVLLPAAAPSERVSLLLQLAATQLGRTLPDTAQPQPQPPTRPDGERAPGPEPSAPPASRPAPDTPPGPEWAELAPLWRRAAEAADFAAAMTALASGLADLWGAKLAAIALYEQRAVRVAGVSQALTLDQRGPFAMACERAVAEAAASGGGEPLAWPQRSSVSLGHLASLCGASTAVVLPLSAPGGGPLGGVVVLGDAAMREHGDLSHRCQRLREPLAVGLFLAARAQESLRRRAWRRLRGAFSAHRVRWLALAASVALAALCSPVPYRLACDGTVEPRSQRFVAAPFAGVLERTLVRPGDPVQAGQVLAQLSADELRLQAAGLEAQRDQGRQQHQSALARRDAPAARLAEMQTRQADMELRLLEHRLGALEIRSPASGVVVSGNLEQAAGAPVSAGQRLFEVAPLDEMYIELAVPEAEIAAVQPGQTVSLVLSGQGAVLAGVVERIYPRAELRQDQSVFVVEAALREKPDSLPPGLSGKARIAAGWRSLGWVLFHRPLQALRQWAGV